MFLSTSVPLTMLNADKNMGQSPYKFSVPYNFVRGRNINININPTYVVLSPTNFGAMVSGGLANNVLGVLNRANIVIPDNVNVHTVNFDFIAVFTSTATGSVSKYSLQLTFDTLNNTITFTPLSVTLVSGTPNPQVDDYVTGVALITISTVI